MRVACTLCGAELYVSRKLKRDVKILCPPCLRRATSFESRLEEVMPAVELDFPPTPAFGRYREYMPPESVAHPAKFNTNLVEYLVLKYTKPNDVILDPMAGTGVLGVIAALHGRNAVQVELEPKFFSWMEEAKKNVEKVAKGWIKNILGDARHLSKLLEQADAIITSPPYAGTAQDSYKSPAITKPPRPQDVRQYVRKPPINKYSNNPSNIGNLPLGNVDTIITSPPFGDSQHDYKHGLKVLGPNFKGRRAWEGRLKIQTSLENIENLPIGEVDAIITSPPYLDVDNVRENSGEFWRKAREMGRRWGSKPPSGTGEKQAFSEENVGGLPLGGIDAIITSPPYGEALSHKRHYSPRTGRLWAEKHLGAYPPDSGGNVGSLGSCLNEYQALSEGKVEELAGKLARKGKPTYLSEMLKIYFQMFKTLKRGGRAIVVVKPLVRRGRVIDLPHYTYLLMSYCGFVLEKLYKLRLRSLSFWRRLYYKHNPTVPVIMHEYILICRKP